MWDLRHNDGGQQEPRRPQGMRQRIDTDRGLLVIEYDGALVDAV